ncbi:MAG: hypothetical protein OEY61_12285 [Gammaproteobacteria bacterium]|nr:hypothetical protein [Gammaproteobacteria bacterium]
MDNYQTSQVIIVDVKMPFVSMVVLMVKAAIASIPAFIILTTIGSIFFTLLGGLFTHMGHF